MDKFFLQNYHKELIRVLQLLKFKGKLPTIQDVHVEIVKTGFNGRYNYINIAHLINNHI